MARKEKVKKPFYKKWWVWLIAIIIIFAAVGGEEEGEVADAGETAGVAEEENVEEVTEEPVEEEPAEEEAVEEEPVEEEPVEATYGIGDTVEVGNVTYTVNEVTTAEQVGPEFMVEEANGIYVIVNATVKNDGNEAMTLDSSYFKLKQGEKTFEADSMATMSANDDAAAFFLEQVNPGSELTGNVAFDVAPEIAEGDLQLEAAEGIFGTVTETINLQ